LPAESYVTLRVYNMLGQELATLVNDHQAAGFRTVEFDANNLPSGIYTYRLTAGAFKQVREMMVIK
jgi:hypothetical protein